MKFTGLTAIVAGVLTMLAPSAALGGADIHGFLQGNYALRAAGADCPPGFDCAFMRAEERLDLRLDLASEDGRAAAHARVDFFHDALRGAAGVDVREAFAVVNLGGFSARLGRQTITWGLGELVFINDVFPKDWVAFLTGAPLEYLKLGSDALLLGLYPSWLSFEVIAVPIFQPDRVPSGSPLFFFDPMPALSTRMVEKPAVEFENAQVAARLYRSLGRYEAALYASRGFYGTPAGRPEPAAAPSRLVFFHPPRNTYGASFQGPVAWGVISFEAGYYDSVDDRGGSNPMIDNPEVRGLAGYQIELWDDASAGVQYYLEVMTMHDRYRAALPPGMPARDQYRHVTSLRFRQFLLHQTLQAGFFVMGSPSDEDIFVNPSVRYHVADELWAEIGGNLFFGKKAHTFFGQFEDNNHVYVTARFAF
ncbi:MAG: hypothetical protein HY897_04790 [Deltaproteobacteria bacterium]|nr:hypothetical protein [Deltaproteobacteria bacterium]